MAQLFEKSDAENGAAFGVVVCSTRPTSEMAGIRITETASKRLMPH